jgi:hypothetical protein
MDHIHRLSREHHELNKGKEFSNASQLNPKSLTTEARNDNSNFNDQMSESSPSNSQPAVSNCEVYNPASNRTLRSKIEGVAGESKLGTANSMTSAQKCSDLVNESNTVESKKVSSPDINTNLSVPDNASAVTKTNGSMLESPLIKRKLSDLSLVTQLSESKSRFLGFRSRDLEHKSSLNGASVERVNKLRGNLNSICCWIVSVIIFNETHFTTIAI